MPQASSRCCKAPQADCASPAQISFTVFWGLQTGMETLRPAVLSTFASYLPGASGKPEQH